MKKLYTFCITLLIAAGLGLPLFTASASATLTDDAQCTDPKNCVPNNSVPQSTKDYCTKNNCDIVAKYVNPLIKLGGALVGISATIGIIWGGIEYSSSGGDPQKASRGKRHITVAIVALIGYFLLYAFFNFLIPGGV